MKRLATLTVLALMGLGFYSCSDDSESVEMNAKEVQLKSTYAVNFDPIYYFSSTSDWQTNGVKQQEDAVRELQQNMANVTGATDLYIGVEVVAGKQTIRDFAYYDANGNRTLEFYSLNEQTGDYETNSNEQGAILDSYYFGQPCGPNTTDLGLCPGQGDVLYCLGYLEGNFISSNGGLFAGSYYSFTISTGVFGSRLCGGTS